MPSEVNNLKRQVAVLREALEAYRDDYHGSFTVRALTESDRIAAEPVEATDAEVVMAWADQPQDDPSREVGFFWDGLWLKRTEKYGNTPTSYRDRYEEFHGSPASTVRQAAAWIREHKEQTR